MNFTSRRGLLLLIMTLPGCYAPWIRTPDLSIRNPSVDAASFTQNDPLPDNSLGPNPGGFRPREALTQRSEPRRTMEASMSNTGVTYAPGAPPTTLPPPASSYPNSISP